MRDNRATFTYLCSMNRIQKFVRSARIHILLTAAMAAGSACSAPPDQLGTLDLRAWRSDRSGCRDIRKDLLPQFEAAESELLGKFADDISHLLGKPDLQQLGGRNQKYYVYFLEKGSQCAGDTQHSQARKAILRFNAIGLLSGITYGKEIF